MISERSKTGSSVVVAFSEKTASIVCLPSEPAPRASVVLPAFEDPCPPTTAVCLPMGTSPTKTTMCLRSETSLRNGGGVCHWRPSLTTTAIHLPSEAFPWNDGGVFAIGGLRPEKTASIVCLPSETSPLGTAPMVCSPSLPFLRNPGLASGSVSRLLITVHAQEKELVMTA